MVERKASEIILDLEEKVDLLSKIVVNQDQVLKLLLARNNEVLNILKNNNQVASQVVQLPHQLNVLDKVESESVVVGAIPDPLAQIEKAPRKPARGNRGEASPLAIEKKTLVYQKVQDDAGKVVILAEVEVLDTNNVKVYKTKTKPNGKWEAALTPGDYIVNIVRKESLNKKRLESSSFISVKPSDEPLELDALMIVSE